MSDARERIIEGSKPLFIKNGFRKVTMDQISRELHISKRTIYEAFSNRRELIIAVIESFSKEESEALEALLASSMDSYEKMRAVISFYGSKPIQKEHVDELALYYPEGWEAFKAIIDNRNEIVCRVYKQGASDGTFITSCPHIDGVSDITTPEATSQVVMFLCSAAVDFALINTTTNKRHSSAAVGHAADMVVRAFLTPERAATID